MSVKTAGDGRGGFFAVDRRSWAFVCSLGLNAAVSYLVMARGTGGDQATTSWSVNAIEKYTGIGRKRADQAIELLLQRGAVIRLQAGRKPRYRIPCAWEIDGAEGYRKPLDADERVVLAAFQAGTPPPDRQKGFGPVGLWTARPICRTLALKGYLRRKSHDEHGKKFNSSDETIARYELADPPKPDWIWLPNTLVDGAGGERTPVELLRQTGKVARLRLFIELYGAQDLADEGGIPWRQNGFWWSYTRKRIGQSGRYVVFAFQEERIRADGVPAYLVRLSKVDAEGKRDNSEVLEALDQLLQLGLVQRIGLLIDSADRAVAEILHSCALPGGDGLDCEQAVTRDAYDAALDLLNEGQQKRIESEAFDLLIPFESHRMDVQLIGVARLRYRPRTAPTAQWLNKTASRCEKWSSRYRGPQADRDAAD